MATKKSLVFSKVTIFGETTTTEIQHFKTDFTYFTTTPWYAHKYLR